MGWISERVLSPRGPEPRGVSLRSGWRKTVDEYPQQNTAEPARQHRPPARASAVVGAPFAVDALRFLELGTKSLKVHEVLEWVDGCPVLRCRKVDWSVGAEVARNGAIGPECLSLAVRTLADLAKWIGVSGRSLADMPAFATGAFRDASDWTTFHDSLRKRFGLVVDLLGPEEEARLLVEGIGRKVERPAVVLDIGGGSTQVAFLPAEGDPVLGSIPLGAVSLGVSAAEKLRQDDGLRETRAGLISLFDRMLPPCPACGTLHGTGGTVKAAWKALGKRPFGGADVERLIREARVGRFPDGLEENRKPLWVPGLVLLSAVMDVLAASTVTYAGPGAALGFVARLLVGGRSSC